MSAVWVLPILVTSLLIVGIIGYVVLLWFKAHSKPCDGIQMGPYELRGRVGNGATFKKFAGNLAEVTDWFFVSEVKAAFEETIMPSINKQINRIKDNKEQKQLKTALNCLAEVFSKETCRLYIIRSGIFGKKELIVQYGDVSQGLDAFASHNLSSRNTLSFGPVTEHFVDGQITTLPGTVKPSDKYKQFGPFTIHLYLPYSRLAKKPSKEQSKKAEEVLSALTALGSIIAYIPSALSIKNLLRVKDEEIKNLNRENHELQKRIGALNTEVNLARATLGNLQPDGAKPVRFESLRFRAVDLAVQMVCLLVFSAGFGFLGGPSFVGVCLALIGAIVGFGFSVILLSWRR